MLLKDQTGMNLSSFFFISLTSAAGERTSQHATVVAPDHLQPAESHRPISSTRQTVQPGDHEDHREICPGEPSQCSDGEEQNFTLL